MQEEEVATDLVASSLSMSPQVKGIDSRGPHNGQFADKDTVIQRMSLK